MNSDSIHRALGSLHSHPGEVPLPTPHDKNFAKAIAKDAGNAIMVIVGNKDLMYAYWLLKTIWKKYVVNPIISELELVPKSTRKEY